jgi:hypothetical protein
VGDCNGDLEVTVDELVLGVNIALGQADLAQCLAFDANRDGSVTVDELIQGVNNALFGCFFVPPTPTATPEPGGELGERVFTIREDTIPTAESRTAIVTSALGQVFEFPNAAMSFGPGPLRLFAGRLDGSGIAPLSLVEDAFIGFVDIAGGVNCIKLIAAGAQGTLDCAGGPKKNVTLTEASGNVPQGDFTIEDGAQEGPGAAILDLMIQTSLQLPPGSSVNDCPNAQFADPIRAIFTTGEGIAVKGAQRYPASGFVQNQPIVGENFSCDEWTVTDGPGMLATPLVAVNEQAGGDVANVLRIADR